MLDGITDSPDAPHRPKKPRHDMQRAPSKILVLVAASVSVLLPLHILVIGAPIGHSDPAQFARLHMLEGFWSRAAVTLAYFPAIVLLHALVRPSSGAQRTLFVAGFGLFLLGNGIDLLFRSIQFLVAHAVWAPRLLDATDTVVRESASVSIRAFNDIAPAVGFCFSLLFAAGRGLMGVALISDGSRCKRAAGWALLATGLLNLAIALAVVPALSFLIIAARLYLWVWPLGLILVGIAAWRWAEDAGSSELQMRSVSPEGRG